MCFQFFLLVLFLVTSLPISSPTSYTLRGGSSISVEDSDHLLVSPNGVFSSGFYPVGDNAYLFAIWFSKPLCYDNCTIVWMANRDFPVNGKRSKLLLQETGNLILTDATKSIAWSTDTTSLSSTELRLYDDGNLVLRNVEGGILWQSFDSPTDTLLPTQKFTRYTQLVSSRSQTNFSSAFYRLFFNTNNLLSLLYDGESSVYFPSLSKNNREDGRFPYNYSRIAILDSLGMFSSSDNYTFKSTDYGARLQRRLTLNSDGNLRLYSRKEENTAWVVSWQAMAQPCRSHGICGPNSTCGYDPVSGRKCSCLPGYKIKNGTDWSFGCEPEYNLSCGNNNDTRFIQLTNVEFHGNDYGYYTNYTLQKCEKVCLELCGCKGFLFTLDGNNLLPGCYPKRLLLNGFHSPSFEGDFYLKVPKSSPFTGKEIVPGFGFDCSGELLRPLESSYPKSHENGTLKFMLWFATALAGVEIMGIICIWCFLIISRRQSGKAAQVYHIAATKFQRFTYSELKTATRNFSEEIGRGAAGIVYKGKLFDNRIAAIKRLNIANQGGEAELLAEANIIGNLNHMNLIDMWGYCVEGKNRFLVYEYMEHGSLAENLSSKALDWQQRFEIALGTARGLAYLHEECLEWVLHCDVKPENILLDSNFQPKVSDFGLSKLLNRDNLNKSSFSRIRGTRGYMAPEWVFNLPITSKVDVYSYGIVVLEILTGQGPAMGVHAMQSSGALEHRRLVTWVRDKKNGAHDGKVSWIEEIIDPALEGEYDRAKMERLVTLALQCVEEEREARPSMSKVVEMLLHHENVC